MRIPFMLLLAVALSGSSPSSVLAQQPGIRYAVPASAVLSILAERSITIAGDRVHLASAVSSTAPEPVLRLLAAELSPDGCVALRLGCRISSECLPFFATLTVTDRVEALTMLEALRGSAAATPTNAPDGPHLPGVSIGSRVLLHLSDRQMHIQLLGIAIDTAEPGHEIRVASLDRRHTYRGIVIDPNTVKGDLP